MKRVNAKPGEYFRSMSSTEYRVHEANGSIAAGTEWTRTDIARRGGFSFVALKGWVDTGSNDHGMHDVIVKLPSGHDCFRLRTYKDALDSARVHNDATPMIPSRFINTKPIPFAAIGVVYDPRATVSREPVKDFGEY